MATASMRKYYPAQGGPTSIGTAFGEVKAGGLSADELTCDEIAQLEDMVSSGILRAEGDPLPIDMYLDPRHAHSQRHRNTTRAVADLQPFHRDGQRRRGAKGKQPSVSAQRMAELSVGASPGPGMTTGMTSPAPQKEGAKK